MLNIMDTQMIRSFIDCEEFGMFSGPVMKAGYQWIWTGASRKECPVAIAEGKDLRITVT
jgi:hypothetical protein